SAYSVRPCVSTTIFLARTALLDAFSTRTARAAWAPFPVTASAALAAVARTAIVAIAAAKVGRARRSMCDLERVFLDGGIVFPSIVVTPVWTPACREP